MVRHLGFICTEGAGVENKMVARTKERSISTALRKNRGLRKVYFSCFYWPPSDLVLFHKNADKNKNNIQPKWPGQAWCTRITHINPGYQTRSQRLPWKQGLTFMFHARSKNNLSRPALQTFLLATRSLKLNSKLIPDPLLMIIMGNRDSLSS